MSCDAYNVWDELYSRMCIPCEYRNYCHGTYDDSNDTQMIDCMRRGQIIRAGRQIVKREQIIDPIGVNEEIE